MSEWVETPLAQLANLVMGQSPDSATVSRLSGDLPFLQGCAEFGRWTPEPKFHVSPPLRVAPTGSILISVRAPVGTMNSADQSYGIGRGLAAVVGRERGNQFLRYAIELGVPWLHRRSQGSTFLAIGSDDLRRLPIRVSNDPAHCETAAKVLAIVDAQIEATEALIAKQQRVRAGLMQDLFTRGVDEQGQLRPPLGEAPHLYDETELGWLPKGWQPTQIRDLISAARAGCSVNSLGRPAFADEAGILKTSCVSSGLFDATENKAVDPAEYDRLREPLIRGAIVVSRMNTPDLVGESGLVEDAPPGVFLPDRLWQLLPASGVGSRWLSSVLQFYDVKQRVRALATGTSGTMKSIEKAKFLSLLVPKPSIEEMALIELIIDPAEGSRAALTTELAKLRLHKTGLMQDLLTGKISVAPLLERAAA